MPAGWLADGQLQGDGCRRQGQRLGPPQRRRARSSSSCRPRAAPARPPSRPTSRWRWHSVTPAGWWPSTWTCSSGTWAPRLALQPEHNLAQVARTGEIDATTVKLFLTPYEPGLFVLAGARTPGRSRRRDASRTSRRSLPLLAQDFDYVVVDTPAGLDERTLAAHRVRHRPAAGVQPGRHQHQVPAQGGRRHGPHRGHRRRARSCSTGPTPRSASTRRTPRRRSA